MRPEIQIQWECIKFTGYKGNLRPFGFSVEETIEAIEEENEEARKMKEWEREWRKFLPTKEERENMFGLTEEEKLSITQKSLLYQYETAYKDMILTGNNPRVKELKLRYEILVGKRKQSVTDNMIETARVQPMQTILERAGIKTNNNFCICPFHTEKTPSFHFTENLFYCFSCDAQGDTIEFVIKFYDYSFSEAVKYLQNV